MSRGRKVYGKCHICGKVGKLTFEHVPPRSAFNDRPAVLYSVFNVLNVGPDEEVKAKGQVQQKGMGDFTLCPRCNNNTGAWYGKAFADWCYQGFQLLSKTGGKPTLYYPFWIFPLRVLKQIITGSNPKTCQMCIKCKRVSLERPSGQQQLSEERLTEKQKKQWFLLFSSSSGRKI